jgi:2,5-diketo-D-gluconate reductase B
MMEYVSAKGVKLPKIGLGTWAMRGDEARDAVRSALELGYRHIDTAQSYGNESAVGEGIRESGIGRKDIFLVTKVPAEGLHHDEILSHAAESLKKLKTNYIDLLLVHWPNPGIPIEETMRAFDELVDVGKVRHIGVSNFSIEQLEAAQNAARNAILTNQVEYHPYISQDSLLDYCRAHTVVLTAYSPVARGRVADNPVLQRIGEAHGKNPYQVALRWLVQQPMVVAIPKSADKKHQEENLNIFDFRLSKGEVSEIQGLSS